MAKCSALLLALALAACDGGPKPPEPCHACKGTKLVPHKGRDVCCPRCEGQPPGTQEVERIRDSIWTLFKKHHNDTTLTCHAMVLLSEAPLKFHCLACQKEVDVSHGQAISKTCGQYMEGLALRDQAIFAKDAHVLAQKYADGYKSPIVPVSPPAPAHMEACRPCHATGRISNQKGGWMTCPVCKGGGRSVPGTVPK